MRILAAVVICCTLALPAVEDGEEWISIPMSFLTHLDIPLVDDQLAPSDELGELLMLSEAEAEAVQQALVTTRDEFLALVVARCEITRAEADHIEIEVPLLGPDGEAVAERCRQALVAALGEPRAELLALVRRDRWHDRLSDSLYGDAFDDGFDRSATITFEALAGGGWKRSYQTRRANGMGGGRSSSSGGSLDDYEQRLAKAVLERARKEQPPADADNQDGDAAEDDEPVGVIPDEQQQNQLAGKLQPAEQDRLNKVLEAGGEQGQPQVVAERELFNVHRVEQVEVDGRFEPGALEGLLQGAVIQGGWEEGQPFALEDLTPKLRRALLERILTEPGFDAAAEQHAPPSWEADPQGEDSSNSTP